MENCESVLRSFVGEECSLELPGIPHHQCNYNSVTGLVCFGYYLPVIMYMKKTTMKKMLLTLVLQIFYYPIVVFLNRVEVR